MLSRNNTFFYPYTTSSSGFLDFCKKTPNIIRIDHIKMCLIVPFINQRVKPMFRALNFDKYYK